MYQTLLFNNKPIGMFLAAGYVRDGELQEEPQVCNECPRTQVGGVFQVAQLSPRPHAHVPR